MPNSIGAAVEFQNFATGECANVTGISIQHSAVRTAHATTPSGADVPQPDAVVALRKEIWGRSLDVVPFGSGGTTELCGRCPVHAAVARLQHCPAACSRRIVGNPRKATTVREM
jgi:hypothetical protein